MEEPYPVRRTNIRALAAVIWAHVAIIFECRSDFGPETLRLRVISRANWGRTTPPQQSLGFPSRFCKLSILLVVETYHPETHFIFVSGCKHGLLKMSPAKQVEAIAVANGNASFLAFIDIKVDVRGREGQYRNGQETKWSSVVVVATQGNRWRV